MVKPKRALSSGDVEIDFDREEMERCLLLGIHQSRAFTLTSRVSFSNIPSVFKAYSGSFQLHLLTHEKWKQLFDLSRNTEG